MKLTFQEYGGGNSLVLLHAFPLSSSMWHKQIAPIISNNWRLILPNFPGFGGSECTSETLRMEDLANAIANLLSELKIEKAAIGGLSMGGYVALNFVRMFPEKTSALLLADTSAAADSAKKRDSRFELIEKVKEKGHEILLDEMLPDVLSDYTKTHNKELINYLQIEFIKATKEGVIAASFGMAERKDHTKFLKNIQVPTLLIFGEKDKVTDLDAAGVLHRELQNSKLVTIPDAAHYSNLEQPEQFNASISDFLKTLK